MSRRIRLPGVAVALLWSMLFSLPVGCSKRSVGRVTGSVKLDNGPLADAHLRFVPKDDPTLGEFGGYTGSDGRFSIEVGGPGMAAKPGRYVVLITKGAGIGVPAAPKNEGEAPPVPVGSLPAKYADKEQSPFTVEIKSGETNLPAFELSSRD